MSDDEIQILALMERYCSDSDEGRFSSWAALFTPEGCLEIDGEPVGSDRETLLTWCSERGNTGVRHALSAISIDVVCPKATGQCRFDVLDAMSRRKASGSYRFELVKIGTHWKIDRWSIHVDGTGI